MTLHAYRRLAGEVRAETWDLNEAAPPIEGDCRALLVAGLESHDVDVTGPGMLKKRFYAERGGVLADQPWIHDGSLTVGKVLAEAGAEVLEFQRFSLAG